MTAAQTALEGLATSISQASWFAAVGEPILEAERAEAWACLSGLSWPALAIEPVVDWPSVERLANGPDWDTAWWDTEETLRRSLMAEAEVKWGREETLAALTHTVQKTSDVVHGAAAIAAARAGIADANLSRVAAGAATQSCHQAAVAILAGGAAEHPFRIKFRLFVAGRFPLGPIGGSFRVF